MMNRLVVLALTFGVGASTIGCSQHSTITAASSTTSSPSTAVQPMVDVEKVWQSEPLPDCPKPPVVYNGDAPQGLSLPSKATVADQLRGAQSPASERWVRTKLGWVTSWLAQTRADIISDPSTLGARAESKQFGQYVEHVRDELQAGHDIPKHDLDGRFPEGCAR